MKKRLLQSGILQAGGQGRLSGAAFNGSLWYNFQKHTSATIASTVRRGPLLTHTRTTTAMVRDENAVLVQKSTNEPRFDHDVNGAPLGLLYEGYARENLLLHSEATGDADWTATNVTITDDDGAAVDGETTADLWTNDSDAADVLQAVTIGAGDIVAVSAFVEDVVAGAHFRIQAGGATGEANAWFDIVGEAVGSSTDNVYVVDDHYIEDWGGGIFRCVAIITTNTDTALTCLFALADADSSLTEDAVDAMRVWGLVCEVIGTNEPKKASSYIPTIVTTEVRGADVLSATTQTEAEHAWINDTFGVFSIYTDSTPVDLSTGLEQVIFSINDESGAGDLPDLHVEYAAAALTTVAQCSPLIGNEALLISAPITVGTRIKLAASFAADDAAMSVNGATIVVDILYNVIGVTLDELHIGQADTSFQPFTGHIAEIKFWPFAKTPAKLIAETS